MDSMQRKRAKIQRELSDVERAGIQDMGEINGDVDAGYSSSNSIEGE